MATFDWGYDMTTEEERFRLRESAETLRWVC